MGQGFHAHGQQCYGQWCPCRTKQTIVVCNSTYAPEDAIPLRSLEVIDGILLLVILIIVLSHRQEVYDIVRQMLGRSP